MFKCLAIRNLINRNKHRTESNKQFAILSERDNNHEKINDTDNYTGSYVNATRIDVVKDSPSFKSKNEDVIKFPFIVLVSSTVENSVSFFFFWRQSERFF